MSKNIRLLVAALVCTSLQASENVSGQIPGQISGQGPVQVSEEEDILEVLAMENTVVLDQKRIEFTNFPQAHNPSIIQVDNGYILIFRYSPDPYYLHWISYIGIVRLDKSFNPISEPQILNTRCSLHKTQSQAEDARIFSYRNRLFLIYNDNLEVENTTWRDRRDMYMAELMQVNGKFMLTHPMKLFYPNAASQYWQKNWVPFVWNKTLLLTYMISPHLVLYPNLITGECYSYYETSPPMHWEFGKLRGSTPPQLVDGEYLAFFHSGIPMISSVTFGYELWHYFMGAYTFSAEPPFKITKMTPKPLVAGGFYTVSNRWKRVIFPGGFVVDGPYVHVAYGKDDCEIWIATLDMKELKKALVPLE